MAKIAALDFNTCNSQILIRYYINKYIFRILVKRGIVYTLFHPIAKYTEVRIRNRMPKGFIVKNIFVEITALVSVAISLILLKVLQTFRG